VNILNKIKSDKYIIDLGYQLPAIPMYKILIKRPETIMLRESYQNGSISETGIRNFVNGLIKEFKHGEKFYYDLTLATIAAAMEKCFTVFADEYLYDLSKLEQTELKIASDVAKVCLMEKEKLPSNSYKYYKNKSEITEESGIKISILDPKQNIPSKTSNQYV